MCKIWGFEYLKAIASITGRALPSVYLFFTAYKVNGLAATDSACSSKASAFFS